MKTLKTFVGLFVISAVSVGLVFLMGWNKYPAVDRTMMILGGIICLSIIAWALKFVAKYIGNLTTSILFITLSLVVLGILSAKSISPSIVSYSVGTLFGGILFVLILRKVGKLAEKSVIAGEIFTFITSYGIKGFVVNKELVEKETKLVSDADYKNIILILKSEMGFTKSEAQQAADYAMKQLPEAPLKDKIQTALKYLDKPSREVEVMQ